jgi:hypothetical protein
MVAKNRDRSVCRGFWFAAWLVLAAPAFAQVEITIPNPPSPARAAGRTHLAYELHVTNFTDRAGTLDRVEIFAGTERGNRLADYQGQELTGLIRHPGPGTQGEPRRIEGGLRAIVFVWLALNPRGPQPAALAHRFTFSGTDGSVMVREVRTPVRKPPSLVIGPPLRGSGWIAGNGPSNHSIHRRAVFPFSARTTVSQRFAYDFMKLGEDGLAFRGDRLSNRSYYGYGEEALAVANATVRLVHDGVAENAPFSRPTGPVNADTSGGNFVVLDLGKGRFAFYAHFQPGSIRVRPGQRVRRGQVLGRVGNSGNSDTPHLHFHISDAEDLLASEGMPFAFRSFDLLGETDLIATLGLDNRRIGWTGRSLEGVSRRRNEMPLENDVIAFR